MVASNLGINARSAGSALAAKRQRAMRAACALALGWVCFGSFARASRAAAQSIDDARSNSPAGAAVAAQQGAFLLQTMAPAAERTSPGVAFATTGYDAARREAIMTATGDMHVYGPVDLRIGLAYTPDAPAGESQGQPNVGARLNLLAQSRQGLDLSTAVMYRKDRFTGDDGVVQGVLALDRRFGRVGLFGNVAYAQDPEGDDREGEVALAMLYTTSAKLLLGVETRCRFNLFSTDSKRALRNDAGLESASGPVLQYTLGPVALLLQSGLSTVTTDHTRVGAIAIGGLGAAY